MTFVAPHPDHPAGRGGRRRRPATACPAAVGLRAVDGGRLDGGRSDGLGTTVARRHGAVELRLRGDLDMASVGRFREVVARLRRTGSPVVVDTRELSFVGLVGDRALRAAADPGDAGPPVLVLAGPALTRLRAMIVATLRDTP
jgi:hypothetical protein